MKIVVPVDQDKQTIFKRTGRAPFFTIYENNLLLEIILNPHAASHADGEHHEEHSNKEENHHKHDIQALKGCDVILTQAVGEHMKEALQSIGLHIQKISSADGTTAMEVVEKFINKTLKRQN
ncbi:MAG: NifB/NifX family molybdenum-iron cluster-binding protein [Sulfurimonas sp.]|nr:NifB/NifX family molybdenum-iron cluster-binding protein [Sulfurimonas sp.]